MSTAIPEHLRTRWASVNTEAIDFGNSPFGLTEDGLHDFRGLHISGQKDAPLLFRKVRFEKCDFSYAFLENCRIENSLMVGCKLHYTDLSSCRISDTPTPHCDRHSIIGYVTEPGPQLTWEQQIRKLTSAVAWELVHLSHIDELVPEQFETAVIFCHANWSGSSVAGIQALCGRLALLSNPPPVYIVNNDDASANASETLAKLIAIFGECGGWGESCWIVDHKVVARVPLGTRAGYECLQREFGKLFSGGEVA